MSKWQSDNLTNEKVRQLLSAVGTAPKEDDISADIKEHNWKKPHYFSGEQLEKLQTYLSKMASLMVDKFFEFCSSQFEVVIVSTTEHFAEEFNAVSSEDELTEYFLPFGNDGDYFGFIGIPGKTALVWAKQLLGDNEADENPQRKLSSLEESLLMDLAAALIEVFSVSLMDNTLTASNSLTYSRYPIEMKDAQELLKISFKVKKTGTDIDSDASFLLPCSKLESVFGIDTAPQAELSHKEISTMILQHLGETPVSVSVNLSCAEVSFEEMMNLQPDDVILLDRRIDEPVELVVNEKTVCYGWPVKSSGEYAIKISAVDF